MKNIHAKEQVTSKQYDLTFEYNAEIEGDKEPRFETVNIKINEPSWDILVESYKCITDDSGRMDLITSGKLIFDLCAWEYSDQLINNHRLMLSIATKLAIQFVMPINADVKKN
jgi:hypothetical protein